MSKQPSADLCQILFETAGNAILVLQNGQIVDSNAAACALFNYPKQGLKGKTLLDLSPTVQPDGTSSAEALQEKLNTLTVGEPLQFGWLNQDKKYNLIYTETTLSATEFNGDTYVQATIYKIAKYKETEEKLRDSERLLTDIIELLPSPTFAIDAEGKVIVWNQAMADITGVKAAEILGKGNYEYALPFFDERRPLLIDLIIKSDEEIARLYTNVWRDSSRLLAENSVSVRDITRTYALSAGGLYDSQDNLVGAIETFRDITEQKQAENALRENEQRLHQFNDVLVSLTRSETLGSGNLDEALVKIAEAVGYALDVERTSVWFYTENRDSILCVELFEQDSKQHSTGFELTQKEYPVYFEALAEERIIAVHNTRTHPATAEFSESYLAPLGINATIDVPIRISGRMVGILRYEHIGPPRQWSLIEQNFASSVADLVSLAIEVGERTQLEQEIKNSLVRREREVQISGQVSQEITTITNEEELYNRLVNLIREQFGYYNVQLYLHNVQENVLNISAGSGRAGKQMQAKNYQITVGQGAVGAAAASGTPVLYRDVSKVEGWQSNPHLPNSHSEIVIPIKLGIESAEIQKDVLQYFVDDNQIEAIIVAAIDPAAAALITKQAIQKNMPVIACTTKLASESQTSLIWSVEYTLGHMLGVQAGQWAKQHIPAGQMLKVGVFNYRIIPQVIERENGIIQGIKDIFGENVEIVGNETAADPAQASPIAQRWLKAHPDMHMIVSINDSASLGAYRAVIAAGKNDPAQFFVGGIDATAAAIAAIQSGGAYQATVDQPSAEMGVRAVRTVAAVLAGKPYPQTFDLTSSPVNRENVDEFIARKAQGREIDSDNSLEDVNLTGVKVGVTVISLSNPYFVEMVEAAKIEANRFGLELIINDPKPVLGVLAAQSSSADGLDLEDQLVLEGLSGQIAMAIQKIRLLEEAGIFRRLAEASGQGLGIANMDGGLIYINPTLSRILDHENPEALIGNTLDQYYPTEMQQRIQQEVLPAIAQTGQWVGELALRATNGKVTPTIENFFVIYDDNNQPRYIADLITDITDRKQAETELETRLQELSTLQRLMSHEGWQAYQSSQETGVLGYLFDELSVLPVNTVKNGHPAQSNASGNGNSLTRPVSVRGEVIGTLGIYDNPEHPLNPEEREFLDTIAEQVAEALERARLLEQSRVALAEVEQSQIQTERLYHANRRLSAAPDLQEAVAAVIEGVAAPDINRGVLIIFEQNSIGQIEFGNVVANWHNGMGSLPTPVGTRYSIEVIQALKFAMSRDPFFFNDAFNDERVDPGSMEVLRRQEIRAVASLPLWIGDTQLGTLLVESSVPHMFTQAETEPFASLAAQLTVTIENRRLIEQTQVALAEIEATQRRYTVQAWESYRTRTIQQRYEQTREGVAPMGEETPAEVTEAVARKQTTAKKQMPALTAGNETITALVEGAKSSLTVPLTVRDQIIGVLGLQETDETRDWSPEEIALVEAIAEQMTQAAENIRLLDETQQRAAREQQANAIGEKIRGAQSLEEALQIAVKEVGISLKAPQTSVRLDVS